MNGHTLGMYAQNQMLKPCVQHKKNGTTGKYCSVVSRQ